MESPPSGNQIDCRFKALPHLLYFSGPEVTTWERVRTFLTVLSVERKRSSAPLWRMKTELEREETEGNLSYKVFEIQW